MFVTYIYVNGDTNGDKMIKMVMPLLLGKKRKNCVFWRHDLQEKIEHKIVNFKLIPRGLLTRQRCSIFRQDISREFFEKIVFYYN